MPSFDILVPIVRSAARKLSKEGTVWGRGVYWSRVRVIEGRKERDLQEREKLRRFQGENGPWLRVTQGPLPLFTHQRDQLEIQRIRQTTREVPPANQPNPTVLFPVVSSVNSS